MNFHSTTAPRIREIPSTYTVEYQVTLHYSDTNRAVRDIIAVVKGNTFYSSLEDYPVRAVYANNPTAVKVTNNVLYGYLGSNPISFAGTITDSKISGNIRR